MPARTDAKRSRALAWLFVGLGLFAFSCNLNPRPDTPGLSGDHGTPPPSYGSGGKSSNDTPGGGPSSSQDASAGPGAPQTTGDAGARDGGESSDGGVSDAASDALLD